MLILCGFMVCFTLFSEAKAQSKHTASPRLNRIANINPHIKSETLPTLKTPCTSNKKIQILDFNYAELSKPQTPHGHVKAHKLDHTSEIHPPKKSEDLEQSPIIVNGLPTAKARHNSDKKLEPLGFDYSGNHVDMLH